MRKLGSIFFIGVFISSLLIFFSPISVSAKEAWEDQGLEWYYDNLTDEDRQKIRQAMDYAIPRQEIIENCYKGYVLPLATEIASNMVGYDSSIHAREYNLTKAKELLMEVFGKRYEAPSAAKANMTVTNIPYFNMTLLAFPTRDSKEVKSLQLITESFQKIGIQAELKWNHIRYPQIFKKPTGIGYNYDHGGYDTVFCYSGLLSPDPDYSMKYNSTQFPPGENYQWIENDDVEKIINQSLTETAFEDRIQALKDFQAWSYKWIPRLIICQYYYVFPMDPKLEGFDAYNYKRSPWVHNITIPNQTAVIIAVPGDLSDFNPILSPIWCNNLVFTSNIHLSLACRRGAYNLTHPIGAIAKNWISTPNGLEWTVSLRQGLKFHDGSEVIADDVVFSYKAALECPDSEWKEEMLNWFKKSEDISKVDNYTVKFHLKKFNPYVTSRVFSLPILSKAQMEPIGYTNWKMDGTNTGFTSLIGCGPYEFIEYNHPNVTCKKASTWNATLMEHDPNALGGGIWWKIMSPNTFITTVGILPGDIAVHIATLKNGQLDLFDDSFGFYRLIEDFEPNNLVKFVIYPAYGWSEFSFNHYDPHWGLNPHDPREVYKLKPCQIQLSIFDIIIIFSLLSVMLMSVVLIINTVKQIKSLL